MKKTKQIIATALFIMLTMNSFSQGVGINNDESDADSSAMLDVKSTTKGFLMPRMSKEEALAINNPADGLLVFATNINSFMYYTNGKWNELNNDFGTGWGTMSSVETSSYFASVGDSLFGQSVDMDGDYCIVGTPNTIVNADTCFGKAYIFHNTGSYWNMEASLTASDGAAYNYFGYSVSVSGDYAVVGAYGNNNGQGKAYVFHRTGTTWTQETQLIASDGSLYDQFGYSVSICDSSIIIGAYRKDVNNIDDGKVYIYHNDGSNWISQGEIVSPNPTNKSWFGYSIAIDNDYVSIGEPTDSYYSGGKGYIFHFDGTFWVQQAVISGSTYERVGYDTEIDKDYAIFGTSSLGYTHILHRSGSTWTEQTIEDIRGRGGKVSISGDWYVQGGCYSAQAYIYHRYGNTWKLIQNLSPSDNESSFGLDVSISGNHIIVGAPYSSKQYYNGTGKVYFFKH